MRSFFFVPGNNSTFLTKIKTINSDEIVLELEDGIPVDDMELALGLIAEIEEKDKYWVRPEIDHIVNCESVLETVLKMGFIKIIVPKVKDFEHFKKIYGLFKNYPLSEIILLVEHPKLLLNLEKIVSHFPIDGLAFGLHDFAQFFGVKPDYNLFFSYSKQILLIAKAYNLMYIDTPSMNVSELYKDDFKSELMLGKEMGCDGKFIIHPNQISWFNEIDLYQEYEVNWAKSVYSKIKNSEKIKNSKPIILNGKLIEKPHINLALKILTWDGNRK